MKLPTQLKIGGHLFYVIYSDEIDDCGKTDRESGTIFISNKLIKSEQEATLLHEILHVINSELSEREVEFLAQSLYQIIRENDLL